MKKPFIFIFLLSSSIVVVSIISTLLLYDRSEENEQKSKIINIINNKEEINFETVDKDSPIINVYNVEKGKTEKMDMETYLYGVVSSEMPSTFDLEALKSQAIAARTYVMYRIENKINSGHRNAVICTDSSHCQAYTSYEKLKKIKGGDWMRTDYVKVKNAVDATKGQILTYKGKSILPLYFSTSSGKTENSRDIFNTQYPYLVSVDSPYEEKSPKYLTTYSIPKNKFIKYIKNIYPKLNISLNRLEQNIKIINRTKAGYIKTIKVGNIKMSGMQIRKILNLNSGNFLISYSGDNMIFTVKGYGHGVGMSQWGADGMSKKGYKYYDILLHYFKNAKIKDIY